jgi:hypothetical protein
MPAGRRQPPAGMTNRIMTEEEIGFSIENLPGGG